MMVWTRPRVGAGRGQERALTGHHRFTLLSFVKTTEDDCCEILATVGS